MSYVTLSLTDLVLAALLIVANGAISVAFKLGLEKQLGWAVLRMVLQLGAIGYVLKLVFQASSPLVTLACALIMIAAAGYEVLSRQTERISGWASAGLGAGTLFIVGTLTTIYVTLAVIGTKPWYSAAVFLPILGMILGNALTGVALALETLIQTAKSERAGIEARLALGASRLEAFGAPVKRALRTALMPMLNSMAVSGVVSLPGMMTGQILSGVDPVEAAKYQIMIMFAIAGSTALAVLAATLGGLRLISDERERLRLDRLVPG